MGCPGDKAPKYEEDDPDAPPKPTDRNWPSFGSRFSIFLGKEPHFDKRHPVVGVIVEGLDVVTHASEVPVDEPRMTPQVPLTIADCGQLSDDEAEALQARLMADDAPAGGGGEARAGEGRTRV